MCRAAILFQVDGPAKSDAAALGTACVAAAVPSPSLVAAVAVSVRAHQVRRIVERSDALHRAARLIAYAHAV